MRNNFLTIVFLAIFLVGCDQKSDFFADFVDVRTYFQDLKYQLKMKMQDFEGARDASLKALEITPDSALLQSNLAVAFDKLDKKEDAEKTLLSALEFAKNDFEKMQIYFNLGVLMQGQKKVAEALTYYQNVLEIKPDSQEAKTNIELLIQQQQQDQNKKNQEQNKDQNGQGGGQNDQQKNDDKKDEEKKDDKENEKDKEKQQEKDRQKSGKYKPRPFKGDQLTEGDVKKILGELSQQDQKIRSQYNKKERRKEDPNAKDW